MFYQESSKYVESLNEIATCSTQHAIIVALFLALFHNNTCSTLKMNIFNNNNYYVIIYPLLYVAILHFKEAQLKLTTLNHRFLLEISSRLFL